MVAEAEASAGGLAAANSTKKNEWRPKRLGRNFGVLSHVGNHCHPKRRRVKSDWIAHASWKCDLYIGRYFLIEDWPRQRWASCEHNRALGDSVLAAECGSELVIEATGADAENAVNALVKRFADNFGLEV